MKLILILVFALVVATSAVAQTFSMNGQASIRVETGFFSSQPSRDDVQKAAGLARAAAWKNYTSKFDQARFRQLIDRETEVNSKLDEFINDTTIIDQAFDAQSKTLRVAVRISINVPRVENYFSSLSQAGATASGTGSMFGFLFVATRDTSSTRFDERRVDVNRRTDSRELSEGSQERSQSRGGISKEEASANQSVTQMAKTERGGSTVRQSDRRETADLPTGDLSAAFTQRMSTARFEAIDYTDLSACDEPTIELISEEYATNGRMSTATRRNVFRCAENSNTKYFAIGTLSAGVPFTDSVSGQRKVIVSVNAQVFLTRDRRSVASVGPIQASGMGPDEIVAQRLALRAAAEQAANSIIDQLNAKGLN
jgi:hypothetical protein